MVEGMPDLAPQFYVPAFAALSGVIVFLWKRYETRNDMLITDSRSLESIRELLARAAEKDDEAAGRHAQIAEALALVSQRLESLHREGVSCASSHYYSEDAKRPKD